MTLVPLELADWLCYVESTNQISLKYNSYLEKFMKIINTRAPLIYITLLSVMAQGCLKMEPEINEYGLGNASKELVEGTPEAVGVLALLNHEHTSAVMLDESVELDVRAANAIIDVRDGEDGIAQTDDDNLFISIEEVDSVSWVGPTAMASLQLYVVNYGWVPLGDEHLGTWDGVGFTVDEADLTLELVNTASAEVLDHEVRLDSRAVDSIIASRPFQTVLELSELWYVGESTLGSLKLYSLGEPNNSAFCDPSVSEIDDVRTEVMNDMFRQFDTKSSRTSSFHSYKITGCEGFIGDSELEQLVAEEIGAVVSAVDIDQMGGLNDGVDSFESLLFGAIQRSTEEQLDGDRSNESAIELLESEASQFVFDLERGPYQLLEVWMYGEDSDCREELVAALEAESSRLVVFSASVGCQ